MTNNASGVFPSLYHY